MARPMQSTRRHTAFPWQRDSYFCNHARETEEIYVRACRAAFTEEEFMQAYRDGGLLCMLHLHAIRQSTLKHRDPEELYLSIAQTTVDKYQVLIKELDEIQRKNDYRFSGEKFTESEKTAWVRAVAVIQDKIGLPKEPKAPAKKGFGLFRKK